MVVQNFNLRHKMGLNMLLDIVILDYDALCPIQAKSCTCWQLSHADYLLSLPFLMAAATQNTNNTTIRSKGKLTHLEQPLIPLPLHVVPQATVSKRLYPKDEGLLGHIGMLGYAMLKELGVSIPKKAETPAMLAIWEGKIQKDKKKPQRAKGKNKGKNKLVYAPKPKIPPPPKRDNLTKDSVFHHCNEIWVYDTGCGTHIRNTFHGLRGSRKLKHGALSLYVGNGMRAAVEAIRSFDLVLPSGLIIVLDNFHFAPTITRGVVPISHLVNNGYIYSFTNYGISVSKDNVFYFNATPRDGIYEIDMHNLYPNVSSLFNVSNKRAKHALDSSYR
ncbi:hypothetical protein Tco_1178566 [Tanacetum coccineum]